jgi:hypothetical protein
MFEETVHGIAEQDVRAFALQDFGNGVAEMHGDSSIVISLVGAGAPLAGAQTKRLPRPGKRRRLLNP